MPQRLKKLQRKHYPQIQQLAAQGLSRRAIAARLGMLWKDFQREIRSNPAAQLRIERGEGEHESRLYAGLVAVAVKQQGNPGSVTPLLFCLKTRYGYDDRPKPEPASPVNVQIALPPPMSPEEYARLAARVSREQIEGEVAGDE